MYIPDRVIARKVKEYDPCLYIKWNDRKCYFEIWRETGIGKKDLITPVTESIYEEKGKIEFTPLDERVLWWLYASDSWIGDRKKNFRMEFDQRWIEFHQKIAKTRHGDFLHKGKEIWHGANNFYANKTAAKNNGPKWNNHKPNENKFIRPDMTSRTSKRIMKRSKSNALRYNFNK